jgi:hypothetical protein
MAEATSGTNEFLDMGRKNFDTLVNLQKGILGAFQDINQQWAATINAEIALASETFTKLAEAKSIPDTAAACQACGTRQMEIITESHRRLQAAGEKIMSGNDQLAPFGQASDRKTLSTGRIAGDDNRMRPLP